MRQFNETIRIEISLDSIAQRLLDMMKDENNPHAEATVETIIGCMKSDGQKMGMLYNSMVGWSNEINYQVGELVTVHRDHVNEYNAHAECPAQLTATILDIDVYRGIKNVKVEYSYLHNGGEWKTGKEWIRHTEITGRVVVKPSPAAATATVVI